METRVQYHTDGYGREARPAIDVKDRHTGADYTVPAFAGLYDAIGSADSNDLTEQAYELVQSDFWTAAYEKAADLGLGPIETEGRSGGWLVFTDGRDPQDPETFGCEHSPEDNARQDCPLVAGWLEGYRAMVEWADAYIADAPRKVRDLAQQLAMDAAGEGPAHRMFVTFRRDRTLREFRATGGGSYYAHGLTPDFA
ncbi:MAG TPA: hypothetical protein VFI40_04780 [Nocardioides sp.]|nr:hypothetical protein [Nocardioides sp.]